MKKQIAIAAAIAASLALWAAVWPFGGRGSIRVPASRRAPYFGCVAKTSPRPSAAVVGWRGGAAK